MNQIKIKEMIELVKEILQRYLDKVAPRVDMKEEKELAERYIGLAKKEESEVEFEKAN